MGSSKRQCERVKRGKSCRLCGYIYPTFSSTAVLLSPLLLVEKPPSHTCYALFSLMPRAFSLDPRIEYVALCLQRPIIAIVKETKQNFVHLPIDIYISFLRRYLYFLRVHSQFTACSTPSAFTCNESSVAFFM